MAAANANAAKGNDEEIKPAPEQVAASVDEEVQIPQKVTRGVVRKYYQENGVNYAQVAEHFNIRIEDVIASVENGQPLK